MGAIGSNSLDCRQLGLSELHFLYHISIRDIEFRKSIRLKGLHSSLFTGYISVIFNFVTFGKRSESITTLACSTHITSYLSPISSLSIAPPPHTARKQRKTLFIYLEYLSSDVPFASEVNNFYKLIVRKNRKEKL